MAAGKRLCKEEWEQIILCMTYGMSTTEMEKELGISNASISGITRAFRAIKDKQWGILRDLIERQAVGLGFVQYASSKLNIPVPKEVLEVYYSRYSSKKKEPEPAEPAATEQLSLDDVAENENENKFFETILKQQQQTNAILTTIGRVLAGMANSLAGTLQNVRYIKENNDKNTKLIDDDLKKVIQRLDEIERMLK